MPFSFFEIEENKKRKIFFLFVFLICFYFIGAWLLSVVIFAPRILFYSFRISFFSTNYLLSIFSAAFIAAVLHWNISKTYGTKNIISILRANPLDKEDMYHRVFMNVVEEVGIAAGGRKIDCVVIPIMGMNAFSVDDFNNRAVIGVTEGLLSKLSRAELEAVVGHEAAHIVSRDTLLKTIAVSLFAVFGAIFERTRKAIIIGVNPEARKKGINPLVLLIYLVSGFLYLMGKFISIFISRECEYRADAVAVRLVRDPLSLARALYRINKGWRGGGIGYDALECLFITNPNYSRLDESEGFFADLFSTHPPVKKRLDVLLNMAHSDLNNMEKDIQAACFGIVKPDELEIIPLKEQKWYIALNEWQGPFSTMELLSSGLLKIDSFVKKEGSEKILIAGSEPEIAEAIRQFHKESGKYICPRCFQGLGKYLYEGAPIHVCGSCKGELLEEDKVTRILVREKQGFSDEIKRNAKIIEESAKKIFIDKKVKMKNEYVCPECKKAMSRVFYSLIYPIEIDRCFECNLIWFDKNELEVLQYLIEKYNFSVS